MSAQPSAEGAGPSGVTPRDDKQQVATLAAQLQATALTGRSDANGARVKDSEEDRPHAFWETQPVMQFREDPTIPGAEGAISALCDTEVIRKQPYNLPSGFEWSNCDMSDEGTLREVYDLLLMNYVEDDDACFRFKYSKEFLQWALLGPEFVKDWHVGVRVVTSQKLVGYITAVPARVRAGSHSVPMVEINFLCVHKKLRAKRLAPVLIKEITRRVNLLGVWQAAYTAGRHLPVPVATCQYWHRSLDPKKLIAVGFSRLQPRMTLARTLKLYKIPDTPQIPGIRLMRPADSVKVTQLLNTYLSRFQLAPVFDPSEVAHMLLPQTGVVESWVVESPEGELTDLLSFYTLPSSVIGNDKYDELNAAFMYYTVATTITLQDLIMDSLILAKASGHDVFNALDLMQNVDFLRDLKFGIGDGRLRYYLYNWRMDRELLASEVGLILL